MVSTGPIAVLFITFSLILPVVGLADQSCPSLKDKVWHSNGSDWSQISSASGSTEVVGHVAVTIKKLEGSYLVSCFYSAQGNRNYLVLQKSFASKPQTQSDVWHANVCMSAMVDCDRFCDASANQCTW